MTHGSVGRPEQKSGPRAAKPFRISDFGFRISSPLLQLLRPPNLFTVPGDPLCGFLLANHGVWSWRIVPAMVVSVASYCAGLVINDLADFSEDLRDRPERPLPSGNVSCRAAFVLALLFVAIALAAASSVNGPILILTLLLLTAILFYNLLAKKSAFVAPLAMGLCRGLSVLVGAVAPDPFHQPLLIIHTALPAAGVENLNVSGLTALAYVIIHTALPAAVVVTLYIAGVTALARTETRNPRIPPLIGALIRGLLFIQAGFCLVAGGRGWVATVLLLALWPVSRLVASRFYAS